jgi:hypothetical protein
MLQSGSKEEEKNVGTRGNYVSADKSTDNSSLACDPRTFFAVAPPLSAHSTKHVVISFNRHPLEQ